VWTDRSAIHQDEDHEPADGAEDGAPDNAAPDVAPQAAKDAADDTAKDDERRQVHDDDRC